MEPKCPTTSADTDTELLALTEQLVAVDIAKPKCPDDDEIITPSTNSTGPCARRSSEFPPGRSRA